MQREHLLEEPFLPVCLQEMLFCYKQIDFRYSKLYK